MRNEVILVMGEDMGSLSNKFERLEVSYMSTHSETLERFLELNNVKILDDESREFPLIIATRLGNLAMEISQFRMVIGLPLVLSDLQIKYLEKIHSFLVKNINLVSVFEFVNNDNEYNIIDQVSVEEFDELIKSKYPKVKKLI